MSAFKLDQDDDWVDYSACLIVEHGLSLDIRLSACKEPGFEGPYMTVSINRGEGPAVLGEIPISAETFTELTGGTD